MSEHQEQVALIQWWGWFCNCHAIDERLLFAVPNGGQRNALTGKLLKDEGVRRGVPDLFLAIGSGRWHGLFIEMKTPTGSVSQAQKEMHPILRAQRYKVVIARGFDRAKDEIERYLEIGSKRKKEGETEDDGGMESKGKILEKKEKSGRK